MKKHSFLPPRGLEARECLIDGYRFVLFEWEPESPSRTGATALTRAEQQVLDLVVRGLSNAAIATVRGSHPRTVANQVAAIFKKLRVQSRSELTVRWNHGQAST